MPELFMRSIHHTVDIHAMFDLVIHCMSDSGGDGWGNIVTRQPLLLADEFAQYIVAKGYSVPERSPDGLTFRWSQEIIQFYSMDSISPSDLDDEITVVIPWACGTD